MSAKRSPRKVTQPRRSDERVERAIHLLEILSSVEGCIITEQEARDELACTDSELDECLNLISTLSDRSTGARVRAWRDHGDIVLEGADAQLVPLRLSAGEGAVLASLFNDLNLDAAARERLAAALLPDGAGSAPAIPLAPNAALGAHYPLLAEALDTGRACRILYRAQAETEPAERTVAPLRTEILDGCGYLIARNVAKNHVHRYRLERIASVILLDRAPAGTQHPSGAASDAEGDAEDAPAPAQSLARAGETVHLELDATEEPPAWAGIEEVRCGEGEGVWSITLRVSARPWLFDQVLSFGGLMRITAPDSLVQEFTDYSENLLRN